MTILDERKMQVLRAIVTDYVASREPVGSKALVERHQLGVSPATVRNDMVVLEEEGYIAQPHTSAGRIPTDKGYRLFVDKLATIKPLSAAEQRAINAFMTGALDVNDLVARTVRLLAQLTHQVILRTHFSSAMRSTPFSGMLTMAMLPFTRSTLTSFLASVPRVSFPSNSIMPIVQG